MVVQACSVAAVGEGTQAQLAPARGWLIFCSIISAIKSGIAHVPLPICPLPQGHRQDRYRHFCFHRRRSTLHSSFHLADHSASFHRGVYLVTCPIEKSGVDEYDTLAGDTDTFSQIDCCAALLIHDTHLDCIGIETQNILDSGKISVAKRTSSGPCIWVLRYRRSLSPSSPFAPDREVLRQPS